jgi:hypothetical protein
MEDQAQYQSDNYRRELLNDILLVKDEQSSRVNPIMYFVLYTHSYYFKKKKKKKKTYVIS